MLGTVPAARAQQCSGKQGEHTVRRTVKQGGGWSVRLYCRLLAGVRRTGQSIGIDFVAAHPNTDPTIAVSLTGPVTLTVFPSALRSTTLLKVTVARRRPGECARIPWGDSSIVMLPPTACHISGPTEPGPNPVFASEQKSNCRWGPS
jgi:hypothetical protein